MRSPFRSVKNVAPVPMASTRNYGANTFTFLRGSADQVRVMGKFGESGILFPIVSRLSTATSKAEWTLYKTAASGIKEERVPVTAHPMVKLWQKPNPFMHRRRFMEMVQQHIDLIGEGDILRANVTAGKNSIPYELWPVRPDRIKAVPSATEFIEGYVYTSPDGEKMPLETNECTRIIMPDPLDPYRGCGPVQTIMRDLDSAKYSSEWNARFFENSAEPGGVIQVPETLEDREFDRLRSQWDENHRGVSKAHRVAILEAGATWAGTSFSQKDMQFVELSNLSDEKVRQAFGYPKPMLGGVDDINRANAEAGEYVFAKWLVEDRLDRWKDWLNFEILPAYGATAEGLEWDYESPVPENSDQENAALTAKANAIAALVPLGYDSEELLEYLGWPNIPYEKPAPPPAPVIASPSSPSEKEHPPPGKGEEDA
jgi:HK97 family phage portal protein